MTEIYLIRHGNVDVHGRILAGRTPGIHLNETGRHQAVRIADALSHIAFNAIYSSPMERTQETAQPLASRFNLKIEISNGFHEIDCGDWTGKSFDELSQLQDWKKFNQYRTGLRIPGGERLIDVQGRVSNEVERLISLHSNQTIAVFSHGDPIRAAICYYAGIPLDLLDHIEVSPGSWSVIHHQDSLFKIFAVNVVPLP
ncbi:MAG: phosphoglycerate mutase [Acidobacteria bacterium]|nr:MAG: phosphoglycerate mutase [Acidobacteriota bacterium]